MDANTARREAARHPKRLSAAAEVGANASLQDGEVMEVHPARDSQAGPDRLGAAARRMERRNSAQQPVYQRYMPKEPNKFHIPRKTKEKRALFQYVSTESREYEDMMNILTSSYLESGSVGFFTYSKPRMVHSELLEKEFVEKRKEMKADGRTDMELEESYCFLLVEAVKLPMLCEKGLFVGPTWITVLGNPSKGVYLSRYSDLLQNNAITPGASGEIIIFKVMKGKVKSIYENMKNLLDPTPRFDSHIAKNASKVTSVGSYRAFELTQQYFYEYSFDELRQRPRQVCPYAVVSFQFKGKDSPLPSKPLTPIRLNSQSSEGGKERAQFTVWTGDLVKGDRVLFQISLRSFSPPILPHRLPEKLEIGSLMRLDQVTRLLPSDLLSYNLYNSSQEVVKDGHCCSLLEVTDRSRSTTSVTRLLTELEMKRVVLVTSLTDRGFLLLISSVQMATPAEREESWKRCLQALFVFPESRDLSKSRFKCSSSSGEVSESSASGAAVMPRLSQFIPALHHSLLKARANPPAELSAGVERQAREYLSGLNDGKVRQYPMGEYSPKLDEGGKLFPAPKHHRVNMDVYLHSYLYNPTLYLLSVARARQMVEAHCGAEEPQETRHKRSAGGATGKEAGGNASGEQTNTQKMQQLMDLVLTCKRNAENEVRREDAGGVKAPGRKRKMEQETAERTLKFLKATQEPGRHSSSTQVEGSQVPGSFASVIGSLGLKDVDLREDGSELAAKLVSLLTGISQAARGTAGQSVCDPQEEGQRESCPFDRLATKLGLPTNCDIDLRKQDELEEQTAGSVSSLEGFSPGSHSGETNHHGAAGRGGAGEAGRRAGGHEQEEEEEMKIPWVLIPITGVCEQRYTQRDRNIPQDPRFHHLPTATSLATTTKPPRTSPTLSPERSPSPSPTHYPSPDPSPPASPSQCPSPEPSPPPSPSQCPSPESSPPPSPRSHPPSSLGRPPSTSWSRSEQPNEPCTLHTHSGANEEQLAPAASREFAAASKDRGEKPHREEKKKEEPSISAPIRLTVPPAAGRTASPSPPPTEETKCREVKEVAAEVLEQERETQLVEKEEEETEEGKKDEEEVETKHVVASDEEPKGAGAKELVGGSLFAPSVSLPPSCLDSIVDKHLGDFFSEVQLLLQEQSVHYSFPQSPHSTSNTESATPQHALPHTPISQFSQYVSFYNPSPQVQDYVSSLQDSISSMMTEFEDSWPSHKPGTSRTESDAVLASKVSDFVSSIRAANVTTGREEDALSDELTAADVGTPASLNPALSRANKGYQPLTVTKQVHEHPKTHVTTSASASTSFLSPPPSKSPQLHLTRQQTSDSNRTVTDSTKLTHDSRTVHCAPAVDGGSTLSGSNCVVTMSGFSGGSTPSTEPLSPSEPASSLASTSVPGPGTGPAPPASALSSLISNLQPEVFNSLVEIIKDVKRNSLQFYLHSTGPGDQVQEDVKEYLLKQGNVEQSPVAFLNQQNSADRLLVVIKNNDIAEHVHEIPGLVSLKQQASVVFVGIDTLDDIKNKSYHELFVSGGCIVSDEFVLNPDFISHDRLASLLMILEQHNSEDSVWKWKVHCKTYKKLKEQSRFRRDAANLLDVLYAYKKRQIVEFLRYHHCDTMNHQAPDLNCLKELQGRYTQYRHIILLQERQFEKFPAYSSSGVIVASIDEIQHNFSRLVGYHNIKDRQPIIDGMLAPKGHVYPLSSCDRPQQLLQQSGSITPALSHLSDQLVPDTSCKDGVPQHSETDFEALRQAISQLRAERQAQLQQLQQLDSQEEISINSLKSFFPNLVAAGSSHTTPHGAPTKPTKAMHDKKAVTATLDLIHSALQQEPGEERRQDGAEGWRRGRGGDQGGGTPERVVKLQGGNRGPSDPSTAAVKAPGTQMDSTSDGREKADQQEPAACPVEGGRGRDSQFGREQPMRGEGATPGNSTASGGKKIQQPHLNNQQLRPSPALLQQPPHGQQQWSAGLLQPPHLPRYPFSHSPMLGRLNTLGGGLMGPTPVWPGHGNSTGPSALVWGFQQAAMDYAGPRVLGGYHNPAGQGSYRYRGGQRGGGGFNGM